MADFNYRLSRQGPTGKKGEKGEKGKDGNTPIFSEGTNTATEYTLLIDYGDGNIGQTGNLRPPVTNEGGTYVRYNTQTGTYEINEADIADLNRTQGEVTLASIQDVENETALDTDAVSMELRNQDMHDINEDIETLDDRLDTVEDTLGQAQDNISQAQQDIVNLDNRVESLDGRVTTNEGAIEQAQSNITSLQTGKANVVHTHTISQITDAGALASQNVVDYQSQVINKPTIPTVGDGTITITQGGVTKGTFTTNQSGNSTIELDAGGGGGTYTEGPGITIDQNDEISVNVDNDTIIIDGNSLKANIPDVSNFVTDTQLADTLEAYPTNQALSNLVDYETITTPGQDSWVPLSLSNCRYDNPYNTDTSFTVNVSEYEVEATLSKLDPEEVTGGSQVIIGNIVFQNSSRQTAYLKTREFRFGRYTLVTDFYINGKLENGDTVQFDNTDVPSDIASYSNGILDFNVDFYVASFTVTYNFTEGYFNDFEVKIYGDTNESGGYLYNRVQGEPTVVTKAIIADTAVDGTTIDVNNNGQLSYIGTTGDTLPSQTGNSGKFLTTDGSTTSWAAIPQPDLTNYYTKTQTNSLLDGKISTNVVQSPLEYLPDTTSSITLHNINSTTLTDTRNNGYYNWTDYHTYLYNAANTTYSELEQDNSAINLENLAYVEVPITNGINVDFSLNIPSGRFGYIHVLGYYNNSTFIPVAYFRNQGPEVNPTVYLTFLDNATQYLLTNDYRVGSDGSIGIYKDLNNTTFNYSIQAINHGATTSVTLSLDHSSQLDLCTHVRTLSVSNDQGGMSKIDLTGYKISNPNPANTIVTSGSYTDRTSVYANSNNLLDVHPESLSLKYDSNTLGVNANNELYAISSTPSNMVTTDTNQTITGQKKFTDYTTFYGEYGPVITSNMNDVNAGRGIRFSSQSIRLRGNGYSTGIYLSSYGNLGQNAYDFSILQSNNITYFNQDSYISDKRIFRNNTSSNFLLEKDMLDGSTLTYDSSTHKISAASSTPIKKTITQASANISESFGTVTVTDADVTTSTIVTLYPSNTVTETWLADNLASNIITEGSGSFTFTINGTLPSTFSIYYIIQEVS